MPSPSVAAVLLLKTRICGLIPQGDAEHAGKMSIWLRWLV
ncbi:hypothetical protein HMPREF9371_2425 [Neisseria shayeganii 871]|uniref:Uncharacterized protein n=1 Tax=Neisseria shayeganii 871 TaxID=1032488 RepID=G4CLD4_9NEIS|nr:hypothetical protein HMPREF9371_2425 [Neisseria shayeganii 871]